MNLPWEVFGIGFPTLAAVVFFFLWRISRGALSTERAEHEKTQIFREMAEQRVEKQKSIINLMERQPNIIGEELIRSKNRITDLKLEIEKSGEGEHGPNPFILGDGNP